MIPQQFFCTNCSYNFNVQVLPNVKNRKLICPWCRSINITWPGRYGAPEVYGQGGKKGTWHQQQLPVKK